MDLGTIIGIILVIAIGYLLLAKRKKTEEVLEEVNSVPYKVEPAPQPAPSKPELKVVQGDATAKPKTARKPKATKATTVAAPAKVSKPRKPRATKAK